MNPSGFYVDPRLHQSRQIAVYTKEKGTVVNQDYRSSFIESRTDDVMKLRMT